MSAVPETVLTLPLWQGEVTARPLHGGLSNESWLVSDAAGEHVVRLGRDFPFHHVFRDHEVMVARAAHAIGLAPKVEYAAPGVMVSAYLHAKTYSGADITEAPEPIAALIQRFHHEMPFRVEGPSRLFSPFHVVRDYGRTILAGNSPFGSQVAGLVAIGNALEATQPPLPLVFGHNDLLPANFLETADGRLWLIDFEYAAFASPLFDLAGVASNAGMQADQAEALLARYFGAVPDAGLLRAFDAMSVASLLREAMWAMVSHLHLAAPGADYEAYARQNLTAFEAALARYQTKHGSLT